jgi:intein-encoded DNA endonuclease-like protein
LDQINKLIDYIKNNPKTSNRTLEKMFGISRHKISSIKKELGIKQFHNRLNDEQIQYILQNANNKTSEEISKELNIPASTVRRIWQENSIKIRKFFNPDIEEFIDNYNKLKSSRKMAELYGVEKTTILNFARKIGYINKTAQERLLSDKDIQEIINNYSKTTSTELAKKYNCSIARIQQVWNKAGLKGKEKRLYYSDFNYFESIDSIDKAYFLGFIAADGCVYRRDNNVQQKLLSIGIHKKDIEILQKFLSYIKSNNPIIESTHVTDNGVVVPKCQVQIVSDKLCNDLEKYNIVPNKTWAFSPKNIPENYIWHFIRGYFDGDGSISCSNNEFTKPSAYQINIVGNKFIIDFINKQLQKYDIKTIIVKDNRKYKNDFYQLTFNNTASKYKFLKLIYYDCKDCYLIRKKELADKFIYACENNLTKRVKIE